MRLALHSPMVPDVQTASEESGAGPVSGRRRRLAWIEPSAHCRALPLAPPLHAGLPCKQASTWPWLQRLSTPLALTADEAPQLLPQVALSALKGDIAAVPGVRLVGEGLPPHPGVQLGEISQ